MAADYIIKKLGEKGNGAELATQLTDISEADINTTAATITKLYQTMSTHKPALQGHAPAIRQRKEKNND